MMTVVDVDVVVVAQTMGASWRFEANPRMTWLVILNLMMTFMYFSTKLNKRQEQFANEITTTSTTTLLVQLPSCGNCLWLSLMLTICMLMLWTMTVLANNNNYMYHKCFMFLMIYIQYVVTYTNVIHIIISENKIGTCLFSLL